MPEVDKQLAAELRGAMKGKRFFLFVPGPTKVLVVSKKKPGSKEIKGAKEEAGGGTPVQGVVYGKDGELVFETKSKPPGGLEVKLKQAIKLNAGLSMSVSAQQASKGGDDDEEEELPDESIPIAPPNPKAKGGKSDIEEEAEEKEDEESDDAADEDAEEEAVEDEEEEADEDDEEDDELPPDSPALKLSTVKLQQARLAWDMARKKAHAEIGSLQKAILGAAKEEPDFAEIAKLVKDFEQLKAEFDESLLDKLDEALNAAAEKRPPLFAQAIRLIDKYQSKVAGDPLLRDLDSNPFVKVTVNSTLTKTLDLLSKQLKG